MRHYCTYFDARFLPRGLALYESLRRWDPAFRLHVLCLDEAARAALRSLQLPEVRTFSLDELEAAYPRLAEVRPTRTLVEYYFTCTPASVLYVLDHAQELRVGDVVSYADADLFFFADPQPVFDEMAEASVLIFEHRYPDFLQARYADHGRYNVGLVCFRNDVAGRTCLERWHADCLAWCHDRPEAGRYADQGYLDAWPSSHDGVTVSRHPGADLAPWNLARHQVAVRDHRVTVDGAALIFFHFHRLNVFGPRLFDAGLDHYGVAPDPIVHRRIYGPYLDTLARWLRRLPQAKLENLRLVRPLGSRQWIRQVLYGRSLLKVGPWVAAVHAEPYARPLLKVREQLQRRRAAA